MAAGSSDLLEEAFAVRSQCDFIFIQEGWYVSLSNEFKLKGFQQFLGSAVNGVTCFVREELAPDCKIILITKHVQILVYRRLAETTVHVNLHLPCASLQIPLDPILSEIERHLEELWVSQPWSQIFVCGDLNIEVPSSSAAFGPCAGGGLMSPRVARVAAFADKFNLAWTSTFQVLENTHVQFRTKSQQYLDYVLYGWTAGNQCHVQCDLFHEGGFLSDHTPIVCRASLGRGWAKKTKIKSFCGPLLEKLLFLD